MSVLSGTEDADIISNACLVWNRRCWHYNKQWKPCCGVKDANIINNECFVVEPKMLTLWTMNALLWGRRCWHYKQWVSCCGTEYANTSKFVNIFVRVFEEVRVSVIYTNCPSERYNQIVRRTVYIVEIRGIHIPNTQKKHKTFSTRRRLLNYKNRYLRIRWSD